MPSSWAALGDLSRKPAPSGSAILGRSLVALGFGWASRSISFVKRHIRVVNIVGGSLLVLIGLLMVTGLWSSLMSHVGAVIATYGTIV